MRPEKAAADVVRISVVVDVLVVPPVIGRPREHRVLKRGGAEDQKQDLHEAPALIGAVGEVTMVSGRDAKAGRGEAQKEKCNLERVNSEGGDVEHTPDHPNHGSED